MGEPRIIRHHEGEGPHKWGFEMVEYDSHVSLWCRGCFARAEVPEAAVAALVERASR